VNARAGAGASDGGPKPQVGHVASPPLVAGTSAAAASLFAPTLARGEPTPLRYATAGGLGANEIETVVFSPWMQQNVLTRVGKAHSLEIIVSTTPQVAVMMAAGQIDMGILTPPVFASAIARDAVPSSMSFVADCYQDGHKGYASPAFYVLDSSPIHTPTALAGKTIGVNAIGGTPDVVLDTMLRWHKMDPRADVQVVELPFPSIGPALRAGRIDCGELPLPFVATENTKGGIRPVFSGQDVLPLFVVIAQVASNSFLHTWPDAERALLADYVDGLHWLYDPKNRQQGVTVTAEISKSSPQVVDAYLLTSRDYYRDPNACISAALVQPLVDAMLADGLLPKPVDMAHYVDASYLPFPC
jgi:sulfonate transport system substrate-binding protein